MKKQIFITILCTALISSLMSTVVSAQIFSSQRFPDVTPGEWYHNAVLNLNDMGVILGNDDGTFQPEGLVNRAQLAVMWDRYDDNVEARLVKTEADAIREIDYHMQMSDIYNILSRTVLDATNDCEEALKVDDISEYHEKKYKEVASEYDLDNGNTSSDNFSERYSPEDIGLVCNTAPAPTN